ncbi:MAG: HD domain-containing phosphohydrolase [Candidatus Cloacimonadaceae bacterium]|nr:HD domain-containing phosphohydrolase [Candidatus Cloacimonadaceae bacterium]
MLNISESKEINQMLNSVVDTINSLVHEQLNHIQRLTKIGESLSSETDLDKIFDMILEEAIAFTNADAATIYKVSDDGSRLEFEIVYTRSLNIKQGGSNSPINWPAIPLYSEDGKPRLTHIVTSVYHGKQCLCFDDVYETKDYDITGTINTDKKHNYRCKSMLTIPLKNHEDEVLGIIQIINAMDKQGEIVNFTEEHRTMLNSLSSQAAIALSNRKLIASLENLLMEFMRSIATGIERKSKYSSDHIMRVAMLTDMIAAKINAMEIGKYAQFRFSENELKELSMAGWMHDVGKIITPEFIMDKSTKLETILDRIDLVEFRFERMKLLCTMLSRLIPAEEYTGFIRQSISAELDPGDISQYFADELAFIKKVNIGGEFVPDSDIERIERLAGIGFEYEGSHYFLISEDEKNNLQIRRGTLTSAEMKQMSAHVSVTWDMLSQLSFPKKYKNVAFYAATHHEKLNGKGYPRGLTAEDLPIQSRIIAVADIFEALTAADRPYKKAKTLTESLRIMAFCVKDGDLDRDLLDFFINSGLYLEFAHKYMNPEQIDLPDIPTIKKIYSL